MNTKDLEAKKPYDAGRILDTFERDWADSRFISERVMAALGEKRDPDLAEDVYRQIILDLLLSGTVGPKTLQYVRSELQRLWWPEKYKKQRRHEEASLIIAEQMVDYLAAEYKARKAPKPRSKAEAATAKALGLSVEGLRQRRYRYFKRIAAI